jgi:hypothetical protein
MTAPFSTPALVASAALAALIITTGCGDDETGLTTTTTTSTSTTTSGTGGTGAGGSGGGAAGMGGTGGQGGVATCLPSSEHSDQFAIDEPGLCLVGKHTAPFAMGYSIVPTWGRHDGPLTMVQSLSPVDTITLFRWALPATPTGPLTLSETEGPIDLAINQPSLFMNGAAVDLPSHSWTFVGWAAYGSTAGEAIMVDQAAVAARWNVAGLFAGVGVDDGAGAGRLLHSGLTPLDAPTAADGSGLYAADLCAGPTLCGEHSVALGGDATGPVVLDQDGNLFTTFPDLGDGSQKLRGFTSAEIAPAAAATPGAEIFTTSGSGTALAALAPAGDAPGVVFLQVFNGQTFLAENVIARDYDVTGGALTPNGPVATALTMVTAGTAVNLMTDGNGKLWVAIDTGTDEVTFYVLARTP